MKDDAVWAVEFYSSMCGSCQEFSPIWDSVTSKLKSVKSGKINIDTKQGMALAEKLGVLNEGIPNVQLFSSKNSANSLMTGIFYVLKCVALTSPLLIR